MEVKSIEVRFVSPEEAAEFLKHNFAHQRFLRNKYVKALEKEIKAGRLLSTAEIHILHHGDQMVMINGQHTCNAIVKHGQAVQVTVRHTSVENEDEIAFIYAYGHDNGLKRSHADALAAYNLSSKFGIPQKKTGELASAMRHIYAGFGWDTKNGTSNSTPVIEIKDQMGYWADTMIEVFELPAPRSRVHATFFQRSYLSVALVTMRWQPEKATEFWTGVFNPTGLVWEDPRAVCNRMLEKLIDAPGHHKSSDMPEKSRKVAACWNAYWNETTLKQAPRISPEACALPIKILGTPYDGKQKAWWWPDALGEAVDTASANTPVALTMPGKPVAKRIVTMQEWLEGTKRAA